MQYSSAVRRLREYVAIPSINPIGRQDIDPRWTGERRYAEHVLSELERLHIDAVLVGEGERRSVVGQVRAARGLTGSHGLDPYPPAPNARATSPLQKEVLAAPTWLTLGGTRYCSLAVTAPRTGSAR